MTERKAILLGADMSTTAMSVAARDAAGREVFASIPMLGATTWHAAPGFDLDPVPGFLIDAIESFHQQGWTFSAKEGRISFSVRQHDMVLLDAEGSLLIPALSWQCNAATAEVQELRDKGIEAIVGNIEERFILPKLLWALRREPELSSRLTHVMTSGDYITWKLTGTMRLSASDALSNGLLNTQRTLATQAIIAADLDPSWFPSVIPSGHVVGTLHSPGSGSDTWNRLLTCFAPAPWSVTAGLGDNHAAAVGCGLSDEQTMVVSAGSSGTVTRLCRPGARRRGQTLGFEYYENTLLLLMLADCAVWYDRFLADLDGPGSTDHDEANAAAATANLRQVQRVIHVVSDGRDSERYPPGFTSLDRGLRIASTQYSVALELLRLVQTMTLEVEQAPTPVHRFLLTGGLSRSPFFQGVLRTGIEVLCPEAIVEVSARTDKLAFQSATYGALINAHVADRHDDLAEVISAWCPRRDCQRMSSRKQADLSKILARDEPAPARK